MPSTTIAVQSRPRTNDAPDHTGFLWYIASRERNSTITKRPALFSTKEHTAHQKQLKQDRFIKPNYTFKTEINVSGIFGDESNL
jgi:hypothetical protein